MSLLTTNCTHYIRYFFHDYEIFGNNDLEINTNLRFIQSKSLLTYSYSQRAAINSWNFFRLSYHLLVIHEHKPIGSNNLKFTYSLNIYWAYALDVCFSTTEAELVGNKYRKGDLLQRIGICIYRDWLSRPDIHRAAMQAVREARRQAGNAPAQLQHEASELRKDLYPILNGFTLIESGPASNLSFA